MKIQKIKQISGLFLFVVINIMIAACALPPSQSTIDIQYPTPTLGFNLAVSESEILVELDPTQNQTAVPTVSNLFGGSIEELTTSATPESLPTPESVPPTYNGTTIEKNILVYDEELNSNWEIVSPPDMDIDLASRDVAQSGEVSFRIAPSEIEDRLLFAIKESSTEIYERGEVLGLTFWLNSGDFVLSNDALVVTMIGSNEYPYWVEDDNSVVNIYSPVFSETRLYFLGVDRDIPPNTWVQVELWLNERIYDPDYKYVTGFYLKNDETVLRSIYLDNIQLITLESINGTQSENANAASNFMVTVNAEQASHTINPMVYGISVAPEEVLTNLKPGINSWGGNPNTRYNWEIGNAWNAGRDYFYRNGNYDIPEGNASDVFIENTLDAGAEVRLSVPTLGWVAKNDDLDTCSFPLPDGTCGDADGASCLNPGEIADPNLANVASDADFVLEWLQHIYDEMGFDVRIIAMDNEPELWGITHYDVHPECTTYQEIRNKYIEYATAIREAYPDVELAGPVTCCWYYYWESAAGFPDKLLNGGQDFLPWFLDQIKLYDTENDIQTIDVLDIHYYPDGLYNENVDADTAAHRMRSTRSLWDPTYFDESWIDEPIYLIPRMKDLIEEHYPGLKLGISEWNFGGWGDINGALAVADILGILGREDVYYANYYGYPEMGTPEFFAFKMYTNFDGNGGKFGDTSVFTKSENPDQLGAYAALDSETGNLHIMLINKNPDDTVDIQLDISGFGVPSKATLYRYSEENLPVSTSSISFTPDEIVSEEVDWADYKGTIELPAYSISHYVLEP